MKDIEDKFRKSRTKLAGIQERAMTYDMIHRHAECLRAELEEFAYGLDRMARLKAHGEDPAFFIEQHMSKELDYDLVYQDAAGNIIGIQVGAEDGSSVLLRSNAGPGAGTVGITSHIYAGHILGGTGILPRGTVVVACSYLEEAFFEKGTRLLIEDSLPRLGITVEAAIITGPSPVLAASGTPILSIVSDMPDRTTTMGFALKLSDLVEATSSTAALAYRYLLAG